jgi:hypothetical protein
MPRTRAIGWLSVLFLCGCAERAPAAARAPSAVASVSLAPAEVLAPNAIEALREHVTGSPADVHTMPGSHGSYEIHFGCAPRYPGFSVVSVQGLGMQGFPQFGSAGGTRGREIEAQFWELAEEARGVAGVASIHQVAAVAPCRLAGTAIGLKLSDYRDIDQAVLRLGPWLARRDLGGEIVLWVLPRLGPAVLTQDVVTASPDRASGD